MANNSHFRFHFTSFIILKLFSHGSPISLNNISLEIQEINDDLLPKLLGIERTDLKS